MERHLGFGPELRRRVRWDRPVADAERAAAEEVDCAVGAARSRRQGPARFGRHFDRPDGDIRIGARRPRLWRGRRRLHVVHASCNDGNFGRPSVRVAHRVPGDVLAPEHREMRFHKLVRAREIQPNLE